MRCRRLGELVVLVGAACASATCSSGPVADGRFQRCVDVLRYRLGDPVELDLQEAEIHPDGRTVRVRYALDEAPLLAAEPSRQITCVSSPADPWTLEDVVLEDRNLSEIELALINSELLLQDLSRNPERLAGRIE